jgi:hypothetical protein
MYLFRRQQNEQAKVILDKSFSSLPTTDRKRMNSFFTKSFSSSSSSSSRRRGND